MDTTKVPPRSAVVELQGLLDSPEIGRLIAELDETRWTGRPGYPLRAMVGVALAKSIYSIPTWTRTVALVREHAALREAIGGECPSVYAAYRFAAKLRAYSDLLDSCIARVLDRLHRENPDFGRDLAIDASDLPAYANGQRYVSKGGRERERFSDPDASWGHRSAVSTRKGGGFYGFKVHAAVCARTDLPVAWRVETAGSHESNYAAPLLDVAQSRGFAAETTALDMGSAANLVVSAWEAQRMVGIARSLTDWTYVTYLSDLAVRGSHQRIGIGRALIERTRRECEPDTRVVLLAAPAAVDYSALLGFERHPSAWTLVGTEPLRAAG